MDTALRPRRDLAALEARRLEAAKLFAQGHPQAKIVQRFKVSRPTAHRWYRAWCRRGRQGLKGAGRAGRKPRLTPQARQRLEVALLEGPARWGFATHLWTLERVAGVIWKTCQVRYHPRHVWRVLRGLGWSRQRPARRARERDEQAIAHWVQVRWPEIKKSPPVEGLAGIFGRERLFTAASGSLHLGSQGSDALPARAVQLAAPLGHRPRARHANRPASAQVPDLSPRRHP